MAEDELEQFLKKRKPVESQRAAIEQGASTLGINPVDYAAAISYESARSFDPWRKGPVTKWGQHRGTIQYGEPQQKQYGVSPKQSFEDQVTNSNVRYLKDKGVQPGMGLSQIYAAINGGSVKKHLNTQDWNTGRTIADNIKNVQVHRKEVLDKFWGGQEPEDELSKFIGQSQVPDELQQFLDARKDIPTGRPTPTNPTNAPAPPSTQGVVNPSVVPPVDNAAEANANAVVSQIPALTQIGEAARQGLRYAQPKTPTERKRVAMHGTKTDVNLVGPTYNEQGQLTDDYGNVLPQRPVETFDRQNAGQAVADQIDIPETIKTQAEANKYVETQLRAKYGDIKIPENFTVQGFEVGKPYQANIDYDTLKSIGVDTAKLIDTKIAENRVENPTPDLSIKANMPEWDAQAIKDFTKSHPYLFGSVGGELLPKAIGAALNAGGNTANALAGALRIIGGLNPARLDSMAEAAGVKPYRAGEDVVQYLKGIADTTSKFADASGTKYQDVATAEDKGYLEGRPIQRETLGSEAGAVIGGLADIPRYALYPGGPIVAIGADSALQAAAEGDKLDWNKVTEAGKKGAELGAATMVAGGLGKSLLKAGVGTTLAKGIELGSVAPTIFAVSKLQGDSNTQAFHNAVVFTAFHGYGMLKKHLTEQPIRVKDERGNEAVIKIDKEGKVETLDPKTEAVAQIRIPEKTYGDMETYFKKDKAIQGEVKADETAERLWQKRTETPETKYEEPKPFDEQFYVDENGIIRDKKPDDKITEPTRTPEKVQDDNDALYTKKKIEAKVKPEVAEAKSQGTKEVITETDVSTPSTQAENVTEKGQNIDTSKPFNFTDNIIPENTEVKRGDKVGTIIHTKDAEGKTVPTIQLPDGTTKPWTPQWKEGEQPTKGIVAKSESKGVVAKNPVAETPTEPQDKTIIKRQGTGKTAYVEVEGPNGIKRFATKEEAMAYVKQEYGQKPKPRETKTPNQQAIDVANARAEKAWLKAQQGLKKSSNRLTSGGLDPEVLSAMVEYGRYKMEAGLREFAEFSKHMVNKFKGMTEEHAREIYDALKAKHSELFDKGETKVEPKIADTASVTKGETAPSKIGKSIEQKAVEQGLATSFETTTKYEEQTVADQKAKVASLVTDEARVGRILQGTEKLPDDINPAMFIDGVERYADAIGGTRGLEIKYDLANSDVIRKTSEAAQTLRFTQEREQDSVTEALKQVKKAREARLKQVLKGRDIDTAIKEEAQKLAPTLKGAINKAKAKASTRETWSSFIAKLQC